MTRSEAFEDGFYFPWSRPGSKGGRCPSTLRWDSTDPEVKTWKDLLDRWENDTATSQAELCREYGVNPRYVRRIWHRYNRWRQGQPIGPILDPLAALRKERQNA